MNVRFSAAACPRFSAAPAARIRTRPRLRRALAIVMTAPSLMWGQDSLRLGALHTDAMRLDPRTQQIALHDAASRIRLATIRADARPVLGVEGRAQYQSEVTRFPGGGAATPFTPPHDTYDAYLTARQSLFDPTLGPRRAVEQAQRGEAQAQVRTTLYALRTEVNDAFFTATSLQERIAAIDITLADLSARLREATQRLALGAALPGDTAALAATIAQRQQDRLRASGDRAAALGRLALLTGHTLRDDAPLVLPQLRAAVAATHSASGHRGRPEYAQFDATRDRLDTQARATSAQLQPRLSAFGRAGYGKPGLNALGQEFQFYWLGGVQVQWAPWTWGNTSRERELLRVQREIVATNEAAFTASLRRGLEQSLASMTRLDSALVLDDRVVALRELVEREAAAKLRESAITAAEYVDRNQELLAARVARSQRRVELAAMQAAYLTLLGIELP